jgi:FkbM family methyltransferase
MNLYFLKKHSFRGLDEYSKRNFNEVEISYTVLGLNWPNRGSVSKRRVAIDLGSNIGGFGRAFHNNFKTIYSVEPSTSANKVASEHFENESITNVIQLHKAITGVDDERIELRRVYVGNSFESKDFTTSSAEWDKDEIRLSDYRGRVGEIEEIVTSISLGTILKNIGSDIDLMKCDIEGGEYDALINQDLSGIKFIVMELHYTGLGRERVHLLLQHLELYFDYFHPRDKLKFHKWPPPELLFLINKNNPNWLLKLSGKIFTFRFVFHLSKLWRNRLNEK